MVGVDLGGRGGVGGFGVVLGPGRVDLCVVKAVVVSVWLASHTFSTKNDLSAANTHHFEDQRPCTTIDPFHFI